MAGRGVVRVAKRNIRYRALADVIRHAVWLHFWEKRQILTGRPVFIDSAAASASARAATPSA